MNKDKKNYSDRTPYFYIIQHRKNKKLYAGSKWAEGCHPSQLLKVGGYTTSSNNINKILDEEGLESFEILLTLTENECGVDVFYYESRFLQQYKISERDNWYNEHDNYSFNSPYNSPKFKENMLKKYGAEYPTQVASIKDKISISKSNTPQEDKDRINRLKARPGELNGMFGVHRLGKDNPFFGKHHSDYTKDILSKKNKGKSIYKNSDGEMFSLYKTDPRVINGELKNINKGRVVVIDKNGNTISVSVDSEEYKNGEYTPLNKGRTHSKDFKENLSKMVSELKWFTNGIDCIRSHEKPDETWVEGRLLNKRIKDFNNGFINIRAKIAPDNTWVEGKIDKRKLDRVWINDGKIEFTIDKRLLEEYSDYKLGRIKWSKNV